MPFSAPATGLRCKSACGVRRARLQLAHALARRAGAEAPRSCAQVVKVAGVSLWALFREKKEKPRN